MKLDMIEVQYIESHASLVLCMKAFNGLSVDLAEETAVFNMHKWCTYMITWLWLHTITICLDGLIPACKMIHCLTRSQMPTELLGSYRPFKQQNAWCKLLELWNLLHLSLKLIQSLCVLSLSDHKSGGKRGNFNSTILKDWKMYFQGRILIQLLILGLKLISHNP